MIASKTMVTVSIFARGRKLYAKIKGVDGRWRQKATGYDVGQEAEAEAWALAIGRRAAAERAAGATGGRLTVAGYATRTWLPARLLAGHDHKNDSQRLRDHVLPTIGTLALAAVRPHHLITLFAALRASGELGTRTIRNIYAVVSAMFRDARLADLIEQSPAILTADHLGTIEDVDPTERPDAVFTRSEVEQLISDELIPIDRQVVYALGALAGLRHGEIAALRWRHYNPDREPLGQLTIARSNQRGRTKTGAVRRVPVLPALASLLAEWRLGGWEAQQGRFPGADDLVVPLERKTSRKNARAGGMRRPSDTETRRDRDLEALGMRHRRTHDLRATFITLAEDAGVPREVVQRLTHPGRSRDAYGGYSRPQWETLCRELGQLKIERRAAPAPIIRLPVAAVAGAGEGLGAVVVQSSELSRKDQEPPRVAGWLVAERTGLEPVHRGSQGQSGTVNPAGCTPADGLSGTAAPRTAPSRGAVPPREPYLEGGATRPGPLFTVPPHVGRPFGPDRLLLEQLKLDAAAAGLEPAAYLRWARARRP